MRFYLNNIQSEFAAQSVLAIALAVAIFAVLYLASMSLYFFIRKRHAYSKFGVEIAFMAVILLLSFSARFLLFLNLGLYGDENIYADNTVAEILGTALRAAYSSIGQLTFEGLEDYIGSGQVALGYWLFYWGTAVYCGVMFLSLVTTKISYEIYSKGGVYKGARSKSKDDLFIFKNVTADTVALAECIEKRYDEYQTKYADGMKERIAAGKKYGGKNDTDKYIPYGKMKREQRRADALRVKINKLTASYVKDNFSFSGIVKDNEEIKNFIYEWLIPSMVWAAVCAEAKDAKYIVKDGLLNLNNIMSFSADAYSENAITALRAKSLSLSDAERKFLSDALTYFEKSKTNGCGGGYLTKQFFKNDVSYNSGQGELTFVVKNEDKSTSEKPVYDDCKVTLPGCVQATRKKTGLNEIISLVKEYIGIVDRLIESVSCDKYSEEMSRKRPRDAKILFLGDSLGPFDGDNPLHREIMAHDYYYVSFLQDQKHPVSIFKKFKINLKNDFLDRICDYRRTRKVSVFAFGLNDDSTGDEAYNSSDVFNEIRMLFTECVKKNRVNPQVPIVCYYVLSDNEINYQAYENKLKEVLKEVIDEFGVRMSVEEAMLHFQLSVINEASLSAKCLARKRIAAFNNQGEGNSLVNDAMPFPYNSSEFRVAVLGFGQTGQTALKELFINTAFINNKIRLTKPESFDVNILETYNYSQLKLNEKERFRIITGGEPTQFIADVFDSDAGNLMGLFSYKNPLIICAKSDESDKLNDLTKTDNRSVNNIEKMYNLKGGKYNIKRLRKGVAFPIVFFHETSCSAIDFLDVMDSASGVEHSFTEKEPTNTAKSGSFGKKNYYKAFIISLGDDESNITMANALIDDIRHEYKRNKRLEANCPRQTIYVNLRDERNNARLIYSSCDKNYLTVIPFGSSADMYSYENVIDTNEVIQYHTSYSYLTKENYDATFQDYAGVAEVVNEELAPDIDKKQIDSKTDKPKSVQFFNPCKDDKDSDSLYRSLCALYKKVQRKYRTYLNMRQWFCCNMFDRLSNTASRDFAEFFEQYYKIKGNKLNNDDFLLLAAIEHTRWNRFHISNGWVYAKDTNKPLKEHMCIIPFDMLYYTKATSIMYDAGNVIVGIERNNIGDKK